MMRKNLSSPHGNGFLIHFGSAYRFPEEPVVESLRLATALNLKKKIRPKVTTVIASMNLKGTAAVD
jgi:hypothetical protein